MTFQRFCKLSQRLILTNNARYFGSSANKIIVEIDNKTGIASMLLNNPPVNSLSSDFLVTATKVIKDAEENPDVRGILLTSKLDGQMFSGGLNILDLYQKSHQQLFDFWTLVQNWTLAWYGCKKPTVAAINGHAIAGGCAWCLMCDYRIMQSGAGNTIGFNETKIGMVVPPSIVDLVITTIGPRNSELVLFPGTLMSAEDALKLGMVDDLDTQEKLIPKASKHLELLVDTLPDTYHSTKQLVRKGVIERLTSSKKQEAEWVATFASQAHFQEFIGNYVAKLKARKKK
uniref:enoyl-CoA delta isomerase 1, mitochondrial-like isoform X1 n=1 Tax=Styela clava TaxID=7725 RepID=UPI00193A2081|nr:enoyl-CoA delta isomerase 1, mitochondrial-like isoform X1 [Styela clava]